MFIVETLSRQVVVVRNLLSSIGQLLSFYRVFSNARRLTMLRSNARRRLSMLRAAVIRTEIFFQTC